MDIKISNVQLNSRIFLKWDYTQSDAGRKTKIKASADTPVHEDLNDAIQGLVPHFVLITEMKKKSDVAKIIDLKQLPEDLLAQYRVVGISIEDTKGELSYKISGYKILNTGRTVTFDTPKIKEMASEENKYDFMQQLQEQVQYIEEEVLEYMDGKEASREQTSMEFDEVFDATEAPEEETVEEFTDNAA